LEHPNLGEYVIAQQAATAVLRRKMVFVRKSLLLVPAFKQSVPSLGYTVLFVRIEEAGDSNNLGEVTGLLLLVRRIIPVDFGGCPSSKAYRIFCVFLTA
jgi:hypothetical protein